MGQPPVRRSGLTWVMGRVVTVVVVRERFTGGEQDGLCRVAVVVDATVADPHHSGEVRAERLELMGDDRDRHSLSAQVSEHVDQRRLRLGVHPGRRLVEQQQLGLSR